MSAQDSHRGKRVIKFSGWWKSSNQRQSWERVGGTVKANGHSFIMTHNQLQSSGTAGQVETQ